MHPVAMSPFEVLNENQPPKLKTVVGKAPRPSGDVEAQLHGIRGSLRILDKQQADLKTQQTNLRDQFVDVQLDVDKLKAKSADGLQTPAGTCIARPLCASPPVPTLQARKSVTTQIPPVEESSLTTVSWSAAEASVLGSSTLQAEQEALRADLEGIKAILSPVVQTALLSLLSPASKLSSDSVILDLERRLAVQLAKSERLESELASCREQLEARNIRLDIEKTHLRELADLRQKLAEAEAGLEEKDVSDVSSLLSTPQEDQEDVVTPLPLFRGQNRFASMKRNQWRFTGSVSCDVPQLPPMVPPSPFKM